MPPECKMSFSGQVTDETENTGFELLDIVYRNMSLLVHMAFEIAIDQFAYLLSTDCILDLAQHADIKTIRSL